MDISLKEHIGKKEVPGGYVDQSLGQDMVLVNGRFVGYAIHGKGGALLLASDIAESTVAAIKLQLDNRDGESFDSRKVAKPPKIESDHEPITEDEDDDE